MKGMSKEKRNTKKAFITMQKFGILGLVVALMLGSALTA
jgi:predicted nucleic acid-binding Zn ribbon protein